MSGMNTPPDKKVLCLCHRLRRLQSGKTWVNSNVHAGSEIRRGEVWLEKIAAIPEP